MQWVVGVLTLLFALFISGVAALYSISGLVALFSAAFWPVVIMGVALEGGKLIATGWLHANWSNPRVNVLHKVYLFSAVLVLMLVTAIGIYGYLSKGHLEQTTPLATVQLDIAQIERKIANKRSDIERLNSRLSQLDASIEVFFKNDQATKGLAARKEQSAERQDIEASVSAITEEIGKLSETLVPLRLSVNAVDAKLGPLRYVADLFGWDDPEVAVRMLILALMFAFDPLAVVLVLSASISLGDAARARREKKAAPPPPEEPMPPVPSPDELLAYVEDEGDEKISDHLFNRPIEEDRLRSMKDWIEKP